MPEVSSIQNLLTVKKRSGLSSEKRVRRVPAGKASPKTTEHQSDFVTEGQLLAIRSLRVLTSLTLG